MKSNTRSQANGSTGVINNSNSNIVHNGSSGGGGGGNGTHPHRHINSEPFAATGSSNGTGGLGSAAAVNIVCEDWFEKYALCRSLFSTKGWHPRFCFLRKEGLGYCRSALPPLPPPRPAAARSKGSSTGAGAGASASPAMSFASPRSPSDARCFVPFEANLTSKNERRNPLRNNDELVPVYFFRDVSVFKHPALPATCRDGVSCMWEREEEGNLDHFVGGLDDTKYVLRGDGRVLYYYFALSFEKKKKRYYLFLRTPNALAYVKWMHFLPLLVHEGSRRTIIPVAHPLEILTHPFNPPKDMNDARSDREGRGPLVATNINNNNRFIFQRDPDPCTSEEIAKIRTRVLVTWGEGEGERLARPRVWALEEMVRTNSVMQVLCERCGGSVAGQPTPTGTAATSVGAEAATAASRSGMVYSAAITAEPMLMREIELFDACGPPLAAAADEPALGGSRRGNISKRTSNANLDEEAMLSSTARRRMVNTESSFHEE